LDDVLEHCTRSQHVPVVCYIDRQSSGAKLRRLLRPAVGGGRDGSGGGKRVDVRGDQVMDDEMGLAENYGSPGTERCTD